MIRQPASTRAPSSWPAATWLRRTAAQPFLLCLVLAALTLLWFWPVFHHDFIHYDDAEYVRDNPRVQAGLSWENLRWAFTSGYAGNWHPLTWLSHMLDCEWFGPSAAGPHGMNLALHTLNAVLLFLLLRRSTGAHWRSGIVAALFAWHPLHVESVAWISERKDLLSSLFGLLALLAYVRYAEAAATPPERAGAPANSRSRAWFFYSLALAGFALGLMSKPMLVTLPCVMLLLNYWPLRRLTPGPGGWRRLLVETAPFFLLSAASCVITLVVQQPAMQPLLRLPLEHRIANALVAYCRYLGKVFWPLDLALPYPHPGSWPAWQVAAAAVLVAGLSAAVLRLARRFPYALTGWFWYLGMLVPVIGLVQVGDQAMADRYTYLPLIGWFLLLTWAARDAVQRAGAVIRSARARRLAAATGAICLCLALIGAGLLARRQVQRWRDDRTLFSHAIAVTPNNYVAWGCLGVWHFNHGQLDEAIACYRRALEIQPGYAEALSNLGAALSGKGEHAAAVPWIERALQLGPAKADAWFNLGNALAGQGKYAEAVPFFERALEFRPDRFEAHNNLANALVKLGRTAQAINHYQRALAAAPMAAQIHRNLAAVLLSEGRAAEAVSHYRLALQTDPANAAAHYSLGLALAVQGQWDPAIGEYNEALRLGLNLAETHYNLGYALRMRHRLHEAAEQLREALRLQPSFPLAHFNLACVLADLRQDQAASEHLRAALALQPDYPDAQQKLQELENAAGLPAPQEEARP